MRATPARKACLEKTMKYPSALVHGLLDLHDMHPLVVPGAPGAQGSTQNWSSGEQGRHVRM